VWFIFDLAGALQTLTKEAAFKVLLMPKYNTTKYLSLMNAILLRQMKQGSITNSLAT